MARKFVHSVDCSTWCSCPASMLPPAIPIWRVPPSNPSAMLPATTPTRISINATEIPVQIEIKLPTSASPIQIAAINQMLFSISSSPSNYSCDAVYESPPFRQTLPERENPFKWRREPTASRAPCAGFERTAWYYPIAIEHKKNSDHCLSALVGVISSGDFPLRDGKLHCPGRTLPASLIPINQKIGFSVRKIN